MRPNRDRVPLASRIAIEHAKRATKTLNNWPCNKAGLLCYVSRPREDIWYTRGKIRHTFLAG
jgi:hypothetical protein